MDENRLTEVEVRYSYLERIVEDLSQVLREQQLRIDSLLTRLERLEETVAEDLDPSAARPPNEKPPHY